MNLSGNCEAHISETEGQVIMEVHRKETSKPDITGSSEEDGDRVRENWDGVDGVGENWNGVDGERKAEADGERTEEGLDRASATTFSGPDT